MNETLDVLPHLSLHAIRIPSYSPVLGTVFFTERSVNSHFLLSRRILQSHPALKGAFFYKPSGEPK